MCIRDRVRHKSRRRRIRPGPEKSSPLCFRLRRWAWWRRVDGKGARVDLKGDRTWTVEGVLPAADLL
eukprot:1865388-Pyramimonas_sp.AAC.1